MSTTATLGQPYLKRVLLIFRGAYGPGAPTYRQYPPTACRNLSKRPEVTPIAEKDTVKP